MIANTALRIERLSTLESLAPLREEWKVLAGGVPFRGYDWLDAWWRIYCRPGNRELMVLAARDADDRLVGLAPLFLEHAVDRTITIQLMGSGEVTSDYLTILSSPGRQAEVGRSVADWLCDRATCEAGRPAWNRLELAGVQEDHPALSALLDECRRHGRLVQRYRREQCWRMRLPATWDEYLAVLSKSHRKRVRKLDQQYFASGRARLRVVETEAELWPAFDLLVDLHRRRRHSLQDDGCFNSPQFMAFFEFVTYRLLAAGQLRLAVLDVDGEPVAAEYQMLSDDAVYAYQSGMDPEASEHQPGSLATMALIKMAIAEGRRTFDFLRGDEPYKAHWRAEPLSAIEIQVTNDTPTERLRHQIWIAGRSVKRWIRTGLTASGVWSR